MVYRIMQPGNADPLTMDEINEYYMYSSNCRIFEEMYYYFLSVDMKKKTTIM